MTDIDFMYNGILPVDKPEGFTSFDVIAKLRGVFGFRKIGHGGTLDPMATGVLPLFFGFAAKAVDVIPNQQKSYRAAAVLGIKTDTADITGNILSKTDVTVSRSDIESAMSGFLGELQQIPPMYSAVKVNGKKLYEIARSGKTAERKPRKIEIKKLELEDFDQKNGVFRFFVKCSKGTYVRTLAEQIAEQLGTSAALCSLRRTESAGFSIENCFTLAEIETAVKNGAAENILLPVESAFSDYPECQLDFEQKRRFLNGARLNIDLPDGVIARAKHGDEFLGLVSQKDGRAVKLKQFFGDI